MVELVRITRLRIFNDDAGVMNRSVQGSARRFARQPVHAVREDKKGNALRTSRSARPEICGAAL